MGKNLTDADGHQLFADMLREVHADWRAQDEAQMDASGDDDWRKLRGDILLRYIVSVNESKSVELARGFYAAFTDYIGSCVDGGVPDPELYERTA